MEASQKSKTRQNTKPSLYLCQLCQIKFAIEADKLLCPKCGAKGYDNLVPIYMENDPEESEMYSKAHWQAGD